MKVTVAPLALLLAASCLACDAMSAVSGEVIGIDCAPLAGATVTLSFDGRTETTVSGADGRFELGMIHGPTRQAIRLEAHADGLGHARLDLPAGHHYHDLVLRLRAGDS